MPPAAPDAPDALSRAVQPSPVAKVLVASVSPQDRNLWRLERAVTKVTAEHPFQLPATRTQRAAAVGVKVDRALAADQPAPWLAYEDRDLGHTARPGVVAGWMDDRIQR
jgi:hypothetical protein